MKKIIFLSLVFSSLVTFAACQKECPECPQCAYKSAPTVSTACGMAEDSAKDAQPAAKPVADTAVIEAGAEEIVLPKPVLGDVTLEKVLQDRRSVRQYTEDPLKLQDVSNLLWAANGINREDGKRTAPSAMNKQSVTIYATFEKGAYKYDHVNHKLVRLSTEDLRPLKQAPMELIFTSNLVNDDPAKGLDFALMRGIDSGTVAQNAALYCAAAGLGTVIRMIRQRDEQTVKALNIAENEHILFNMAVGYEKK